MNCTRAFAVAIGFGTLVAFACKKAPVGHPQRIAPVRHSEPVHAGAPASTVVFPRPLSLAGNCLHPIRFDASATIAYQVVAARRTNV